MNLHLHSEEKIRTSIYKDAVFIDIDCLEQEQGLCATAYGIQGHFIEIRKLGIEIKMFSFPSIEWYNDYDFGVWINAEIIYKTKP